VEQGKIADLLILSEDPLDDIRNTLAITHVIKDGMLYDADTLKLLSPVADD